MTDVPVKISFGDQNLRSALRCGSSVKSITCSPAVLGACNAWAVCQADCCMQGAICKEQQEGTLAMVQRVVASCSPCTRMQEALCQRAQCFCALTCC